MRDVLSLYPRFLIFSGIMAAFLVLLALMPGASDATAISQTVQTTGADNTRPVETVDCRAVQQDYVPTCTTQGRVVRVIKF